MADLGPLTTDTEVISLLQRGDNYYNSTNSPFVQRLRRKAHGKEARKHP